MKKYLLFVLLLATPLAWSQELAGITAAKEWLNVIDRGKYIESWESADMYFKNQLSADNWQQALQGSRTPLGNVVSRKVTSSKAFTSLPGVPDGNYVVIVFSTVYENKKSSTETVTFSKNSGSWKAVGYFIK